MKTTREASCLLFCSFLFHPQQPQGCSNSHKLDMVFKGHKTDRRQPEHSTVHPRSALSHSAFPSTKASATTPSTSSSGPSQKLMLLDISVDLTRPINRLHGKLVKRKNNKENQNKTLIAPSTKQNKKQTKIPNKTST